MGAPPEHCEQARRIEPGQSQDERHDVAQPIEVIRPAPCLRGQSQQTAKQNSNESNDPQAIGEGTHAPPLPPLPLLPLLFQSLNQR